MSEKPSSRLHKRLRLVITTSPRTPTTKKVCASPVKPTALPGTVSTVASFLLISDDRVPSCELEALNVTAIIDCRLDTERELRGRLKEEPDNYLPRVKRLDLPLRDVSTEDVSKYLLFAVHFIEQERISGGKVLVHCTRGISRSSAVVCAYLMWSKHLTFRGALGELRKCHPSAEPNPSFAMQLVEFETVRSKDRLAFEISSDGLCAVGPLSKEAAEMVLEGRSKGVLLVISRPDGCQYLFSASGEGASLQRAESFANMLSALDMAPTKVETISPISTKKIPCVAEEAASEFDNNSSNVRFLAALNDV